MFYNRLVYALNKDESGANDKIDIKRAQRSLLVDWSNDSGGVGHLDKPGYLDSVFELGETWAEDQDGDGDIDAHELTELLQSLRPNIFEIQWDEVAAWWISHRGARVITKEHHEKGTVRRILADGWLGVEMDDTKENRRYVQGNKNITFGPGAGGFLILHIMA